MMLRLAAAMILWRWMIGPDPASWWVGIPVSLAAAFAAGRLGGYVPTVYALVRWPRFAVRFLVQSFIGAWDVARRALSPTPDLNPGFTRHELERDHPGFGPFLANVISLLPGTLTVEAEEGALIVHSLDASASAQEEFDASRRLVDDVFPPSPGAGS